MNRIIASLKFLLLLFVTPSALAQSWQWGLFSGSGGSFSFSRDLQVDQYGNTYELFELTAGSTDVYLGGNVLSGRPKGGLCIASHDPDGTLRWAKVIQANSVSGKSLRVTASGKVFVFAELVSTVTVPLKVDLDTLVQPTKAIQQMTLLCYDTGGRFQWLRRPDTNFTFSGYGHNAYSMDVDESDNVYCLVSLPPGNPLLGTTLTIPSFATKYGQGLSLLVYDAAGAMTSVIRLQDYYRVQLKGVDPQLTYNRFDKGFYVCTETAAVTADSVFIKDVRTYNPTLLAAFRADGSMKWYRQDTATLSGAPLMLGPVLVDANSDLYIYGTMQKGPNYFAGYHITGICPTGFYNIPFVIKLDSNGNLKWGTNGGAFSCAVFNHVPFHLSISEASVNTGLISGSGWSKLFFGDPTKDTIWINSGTGGLDESGAWYGLIDLSTGKTKKLSTIQGKVKNNNWGWSKTAFYRQNYYYMNATEGRTIMFDSSLRVYSKRTVAGPEIILAKFAVPVGCASSPIASFTRSGTLFTFTGTSPNDSVTWDFGDGSFGKGSPISHSYKAKGKYMVCVTVWTAACGKNSRCTMIDIPVNIEEQMSASQALQVFPNPAEGLAAVSGLTPGSVVSVSDFFGRVLWETKCVSDRLDINISSLPPAIYLLRATAPEGQFRQTKFIVR